MLDMTQQELFMDGTEKGVLDDPLLCQTLAPLASTAAALTGWTAAAFS